MKLVAIGVALLVTGFTATSALAQAGTMQPIPNPPEKGHMTKHHMMKHRMAHHMTKKDDDAAQDKAQASSSTMPSKKK